jgi:hypothetical protein
MKCSRWIAAAVAVPLLMAHQALADFNYSTAITPTSATIGPNSSLSFASVASSTPQTPIPGVGVGISIAQISVASTASSTEGPVTVNFTDTITISPTSGGSGILTVMGSITVSASQTGQSSTFTFNPTGSTTSVTIGGVTYSYNPASLGYSQPTVNVPNSGGLSLNIMTVPEPASLAMLGVGGLVLAAPRLRRLARSTRV